MNTISILKLLVPLNKNTRKLSLCNLIRIQDNAFVKEEVFIGLASPLSASIESNGETPNSLAESTLDQMLTT